MLENVNQCYNALIADLGYLFDRCLLMQLSLVFQKEDMLRINSFLHKYFIHKELITKKITIKSCLVAVYASKALPPALRGKYYFRLCSYIMQLSLRWVLTWPIFSSLYRLVNTSFTPFSFVYFLVLLFNIMHHCLFAIFMIVDAFALRTNTLCSFLFSERGGVDCFP